MEASIALKLQELQDITELLIFHKTRYLEKTQFQGKAMTSSYLFRKYNHIMINVEYI